MLRQLTEYPVPTVSTACPVNVAIVNRWGLMASSASSLIWNDKKVNLIHVSVCYRTASVVYWSEFLATDTEVPGSIPGATRFSE